MAIGPVTCTCIAIGPVVTCFSMFTHVRITFIAFSVLHRFVVLSIQFAMVYWYFMFSFLWKDFIMIT